MPKDPIKRKALIAEILDLLEKTGKDKYWVLDEIKKDIKVKVLPAMRTFEILDSCPTPFLLKLKALLRYLSEPEHEPPKYTNTYHWFFTDIVASANPDIATEDQTRKIIALNNLIRKTSSFKTRDPNYSIILPTGDGVAIGFKDSAEKPLLLAIELHKALNEYNADETAKGRLDIRIGLDTGPVYPIKDLNEKDNVWGPGIIYARRIMDLGGPKNILASGRFANDVERLRPGFKKIMHLIGNYPIKHDELISICNVYGNIYGAEIGTRKDPLTKRVEKGASVSEMRETANTFVFDYIEVNLDIIDPKTMLTHHTWVWSPVNQRDQSVERIFYYIDGDVPKNFPDLNVRVTDENGKDLQIQSLSVNKPEHKEFYVQLDKPLKPKQKGRFVKLEYDWEEPDKHFVYNFASICKKFRYLMTAPKGMPISQKVVKILREIGEKEHASTPATVRYLKDKTEVEWIGRGLQPFDAYRFDW